MDLTKIAEMANPAVTALLGGSGIWAWAKTKAEYQIYSDLGGNGLARRIFEQVDKLPMMPNGIDGRKNK